MKHSGEFFLVMDRADTADLRASFRNRRAQRQGLFMSLAAPRCAWSRTPPPQVQGCWQAVHVQVTAFMYSYVARV